MQVLEGESLLNDASGLVAMKFAIAATLTGSFSLLEATCSFFVIAIGGISLGVSVAWLFGWVQDKLSGWRGEELSVQLVLLRLLLPFGVYLLAEHLAFSGILAVVAAGVTVDLTDRHRSGALASRMQTRELRTMIEFVFNGIIFLLLGLRLPEFIGRPLRGAYESVGPGQAWRLLGLTASALVGAAGAPVCVDLGRPGGLRPLGETVRRLIRSAVAALHGCGGPRGNPRVRHVGGRAVAASGPAKWFALPRARSADFLSERGNPIFLVCRLLWAANRVARAAAAAGRFAGTREGREARTLAAEARQFARSMRRSNRLRARTRRSTLRSWAM